MASRFRWALLLVIGATACTAATIGATGRAGGPDRDLADGGAEPPPGDTGGDPSGLGAQATDAAVAPEPAAPPPAPLHVAVLSDLNDAYGSTTYSRAVRDAVAKVIELGPDLVLCTGDMVAGQQAGLDYGAMWAGFHDEVSEPLAAAGIPLAVTPGNHDASGYPAFEGEREIYVAEWSARRPAVTFRDDTDYPLRYTFSVGDVLFASLDDTLVAPLDADQHGWLDAELAAGADFPVKIVFGHLPIWPFTQGRETEVMGDADLEQTLVDRGVTLFLSGHHHGYYPGRHGGLRQVSMACLGAGSRRLIGTSTTSALAFAWIEIAEGEVRTLEAYAAPDFTTPIARGTLPEQVGVVTRDDL